ncbi:MAG: hypothetical protein LBS97_05675, partial [Treponema sp.]|nr:hypothetical protein [Treponema sp.]
MNAKKYIFIYASIFVLLAAAGIAGFLYYNIILLNSGETEKSVTVPAGMTVRQVAEKLQEEKLVRSADFFYYYARYKQSG